MILSSVKFGELLNMHSIANSSFEYNSISTSRYFRRSNVAGSFSCTSPLNKTLQKENRLKWFYKAEQCSAKPCMELSQILTMHGPPVFGILLEVYDIRILQKGQCIYQIVCNTSFFMCKLSIPPCPWPLISHNSSNNWKHTRYIIVTFREPAINASLSIPWKHPLNWNKVQVLCCSRLCRKLIDTSVKCW